jgi:hypothetical protein
MVSMGFIDRCDRPLHLKSGIEGMHSQLDPHLPYPDHLRSIDLKDLNCCSSFRCQTLDLSSINCPLKVLLPNLVLRME